MIVIRIRALDCRQAADEVWSAQLADLVVNQLPVHAGTSSAVRTNQRLRRAKTNLTLVVLAPCCFSAFAAPAPAAATLVTMLV